MIQGIKKNIKNLKKYQKLIFSFVLIVLLVNKYYLNENKTFDEYFKIFSKELKGEYVVYNSKFKNTLYLKNNMLASFTLGEKIPSTNEFRFETDFLLGVRIVSNEEKKIKGIAIYVDDYDKQQESGRLEDYFTYRGFYGEPIVIKKDKYVVFLTEEASLMIGVYKKNDYFIALLDKRSL